MKVTKNEKGYVLIIALLTIVLLTIFSMAIIPRTISVMKQFGITESNTQNKQMAEMGIQYAEAELNKLVTKSIDDVRNDTNISTTNHDRLFCEKFNSNRPSNYKKTVKMEGNRNFSFLVDMTVPQSSCDNFKEVIINVQSTGIIDGKVSKPITASFFINNKGLILSTKPKPGDRNNPIDPNQLPLNPEYSNVSYTGQESSKLFRSSRFRGTVDIKGNALLSVGGNAWFDGLGRKGNENYSVNFSGNGRLVVSGDAYFTNPISWSNNANVCIQGDAYIYDGRAPNGWKIYDDVIDKKFCPSNKEREVEYFYDYSEWQVDPEKLVVTY